MSNGVTAWSYSRWKDYDKCPALTKYKVVEKRKTAGSPAMDRGNVIHKLAEDYAKGLLKDLPPELKLMKEQFELLRDCSPVCEEQWAFTQKWTETSWFAKDAWLRLKMDVACVDDDTLYIIDHKTGKKYDDHKEQLSLYAPIGFIKFPAVTKVSAQIWYLDQGGEPLEVEYERKDLSKLKSKWTATVKPMFTDTQFKPKPGNYCRWCDFSKGKGGPCQY